MEYRIKYSNWIQLRHPRLFNDHCVLLYVCRNSGNDPSGI